MRKVNWEGFYNFQQVNDAWGFLRKPLTVVFNKHAPIIAKKVNGKPVPCSTNDVKAMMNERDNLLCKSRQKSSEAHISAYKRKRNEVKKGIQKSKSTYNKNLLRENSNDPKKFWKMHQIIYGYKFNCRLFMFENLCQ